MFLSHIAVTVLVSASCVRTEADILTDITKISRNWGQISPYADNTDDYFGVDCLCTLSYAPQLVADS
jgi:hypothetical protein